MRAIIAALYFTAGIAHIGATDTLMMITPSWVPFPREVILSTGIFELVAAAALFTERFRKTAGIALAVYAICVWPANFKHAIDGIAISGVPATWWYHGPRLALQPVIVWWTLFSVNAIDWPFRRTSRKTHDSRD